MPAPRWLAPAALLGLTLSGCIVGPNYEKPALNTPQQYGHTAELARREAAPAPELPRWWEGFDDPLLAQLVTRALSDNLDLAQAAARITQARALLDGANAALLPSATVAADAGHLRQSVQTPSGRALSALVPNFSRDSSSYAGNLAATWEIDFFGGQRRNREAAAAEVEATEADAVAIQLGVAAQTADTYLLIRGLEARLAIAREQASAQRQLMDMVKLQFDAGVAPELQWRQAVSLVMQTEAVVPALESALESARNALDIGLGAQPGTHAAARDVPGEVPAAPGLADLGGPPDLIRRRPDLIAAERRLAASNAAVGAAIAEYYPKISLNGLVGTATSSFGGLFSGASTQAQAGAGLRWRLFDFPRIEAEIAASKGRRSEALAAYKLAVLAATGDVENAVTALLRSEQQERLLGEGEQALSRACAASRAAYQSGTVSLVDVLDAELRLLAIRDARVVAKTASARAAVASFKALGGGWETGTALAQASPGKRESIPATR